MLSTEHIVQEQKGQRECLKVLERKLLDADRQIKMAVITARISAIVGTVATAMLMLL